MRAFDKAKARWGQTYEQTPRFEGLTVYRDITVGGESDTHAGNRYGSAHPDFEQQARFSSVLDDDDFLEDFDSLEKKGRVDFRDRHYRR